MVKCDNGFNLLSLYFFVKFVMSWNKLVSFS